MTDIYTATFLDYVYHYWWTTILIAALVTSLFAWTLLMLYLKFGIPEMSLMNIRQRVDVITEQLFTRFMNFVTGVKVIRIKRKVTWK